MSTLLEYLTTLPGRCTTCGYHIELQGCVCPGLAAKDAGQARAAAAHPDELARVEAAIRQAAATGQSFSANSIRPLHGVKGGVVGKAFTNMKNAGVIKACGDDTSTSESTHGHRIFRWIGVAS